MNTDLKIAKQLYTLARLGKIDEIKNELSKGVDINAQHRGASMIEAAIVEKNISLLNFLIKEGANVNIQSENGWTPLHFAAQENSLEIVKVLLENGALLNVKDKNGNTALHTAIYNSKGQGDVITLLLEGGADKNLKNNHGVSPLDLAKQIANYDVKKFFIEK